MAKKDIWDIIFWIALFILIGYIIGKLLGWINTPEWVDLIPAITFVFLVGAFYQKVMNFMSLMEHRTDYFKTHLDAVEQKIDSQENRITLLEKARKHKKR